MSNSTIVPYMGYHDAVAAVDWLCDVFGFHRHAYYPDEQGGVMHSELTLGGGMVMVSSLRKEGAYAPYARHPDDCGGGETVGVALIVDDPDAIYAKAVAKSAEMLIDIADNDYGGRSFTCRDPYGHIWSVGSYDPWSADHSSD